MISADQASSATILALAAAYLRDDLRPELNGRHRFMTLIAANAIDIVAREIRLAPGAVQRETERLKALLSSGGDRAALDLALCEALAKGHLDENSPGVLEHLFASTMDHLEIDQPGYAAYRLEIAALRSEDTK